MIVASLATLSSREHLLEQVIESLAPQVDAICVYLNGHERVPSCVRHPKVLHATMSREAGWRGAEAKLWFFDRSQFKAAPEWNDDDIAIVCDDDIIYPPDYVEKMVAALRRHPGSVVCVHASIMTQPFESYGCSRVVAGCRDEVPQDARVHIPGTGCMAFEIGTLPLTLKETFKWSHAVDPHIATLCNERGVEVWTVARPANWLNPLALPRDGTNIFNQRVGVGVDDKETTMLRDSSPPWASLETPKGFTSRASLAKHRRLNASVRSSAPKFNPSSMMALESFEWLRPRLAAFTDGWIVELGSGHGTAHLLNLLPPGVGLMSVEHDPRFMNLISGSHYVHAPLLPSGWYDPAILKRELPPRETIRALIVDGPPKQGRSQVIDHLRLFPDHVPLLIDDVHREEEYRLADELALRRKQGISIHRCIDGRAFATVGWDLS